MTPGVARTLPTVAAGIALTGCDIRPAPASTLILWAWARPGDMRFIPDAAVALHTGVIEQDKARSPGRRDGTDMFLARWPETRGAKGV